MSTKNKIVEEFGTGWKHFCDCINFGVSSLDAEAIRFMNEMPNRICSSHNDLLLACERDAELANAAILANPTGAYRNKLTEINILRIKAIAEAKE